MTINERSSGLKTTDFILPIKGPGRVFQTATGGIGMEFEGRIVVKSIERWIALAFGDFPVHMLDPKQVDPSDDLDEPGYGHAV